LAELRQISTKFDNFGTHIAKTIEICKVYLLSTLSPPHIVYVNALQCKMQMLHIVA